MRRLLIIPVALWVLWAEFILSIHWTVRWLRGQNRRHTLVLDMKEGYNLLRDVWVGS
jgi:hypothetical protein